MSSTLIGIVLAARLKKRSEFFSSVLTFTKALEVEIEYSMSDLPSVIIKISEEEMCRDLSFLKSCARFLYEGDDFPLAWERAVTECTVYIKGDEKDKLMTMGLTLGTTNLDGQKKLIGMFTEYFNAYQSKARQLEEKYYRIYILTGILSGFGIFILLI